MSRLKAASSKPAYDPNEPTDDNDQETPVEVENLIAIIMSEYQFVCDFFVLERVRRVAFN